MAEIVVGAMTIASLALVGRIAVGLIFILIGTRLLLLRADVAPLLARAYPSRCW